MTARSKILKQFEENGRAWFRNALSQNELQELEKLSALNGRPGARVSNSDPLAKTIASASFTKQLNSLWPDMRHVRVLSFDKNPSANWGVPWHQDRVIALEEREELEGYSNWSQKSGTWHCEPPLELLESMLFVRVHLDQNNAENGAMEIALGSHRAGKVTAERAAEVAHNCEIEVALAEPGDILVLKMLTLHRSLSGKSQESRRALRVDFGPGQLPSPLVWAT